MKYLSLEYWGERCVKVFETGGHEWMAPRWYNVTVFGAYVFGFVTVPITAFFAYEYVIYPALIYLALYLTSIFCVAKYNSNEPDKGETPTELVWTESSVRVAE